MTNPYQPPTSPGPAASRPTRWRIAAVTLLVIGGVVGLVCTPLPLLIAFSRPVDLGGGMTPTHAAGVVLSGAGSCLLIWSGAACWRGRWVLSGVATALAVLTFLACDRLLADIYR